MRAYIIRRLLLVPLIVFLVSVLVFSLVRVLPGDAAVARLGAQSGSCEECLEAARKELGLDKSYVQQYWDWFKGAIRFDFGISTANTRPIGPELWDRALVTIQLGL